MLIIALLLVNVIFAFTLAGDAKYRRIGATTAFWITFFFGVIIGAIATYTSPILVPPDPLETLKKEKDKLDLGLITKEEYEAKKQELSKFIK